MTLGLIEGKFKEHRIKNAKLVEINLATRCSSVASRPNSSP